MQIEIDPPAFGPLRLGMTEAESIEVLRSLGELRVGSQPQIHFAHDRATGRIIQATSENGSVMWITGAIDDDVPVRYTYAGIDLNQPFRATLRELLGRGVPVLTDQINYAFAVETDGLFLPIKGEDSDYFDGPVLMPPSRIRELTGVDRPFTLGDLDALVYEIEFER